jgi:TusA-related sulfurtransferase
MDNTSKTRASAQTDFHLDITDQVCPLTFVRTKLLIERMSPGQVAEVRLQGAEPLGNVPHSVRDLGHTVLECRPVDPGSEPHGVHILRIRKEH